MSNNIFDAIEEAAAEIPSDQLLKQVSELAVQANEAEIEILRIELELKAKKEAYREIVDKRLPEAMSGIGMAEFKLEDGTSFKIKPYYYAKIEDDNREACHNWLDEHGYGDMIKHQYNISMGLGDHETAKQVEEALEAIGVSYSDKAAVHWQTLVAWLKRTIEAGKEVDLDLFKAQIGQTVKIKRL